MSFLSKKLTESFVIDDSQDRVYDFEFDKELSKLESYPLVENKGFWQTLSRIIKDSMNRELMKSQILTAAFNPNQSDMRVLEYLAVRYGISFPSSYSSDRRRLILKYFPNFIKLKGVSQLSLDILLLVDRTETELYQELPTAGRDYSVTPVSNGYYKIQLPSRIKSVKLAQELVNRVTSEGFCYQVIPSGESDYVSASELQLVLSNLSTQFNNQLTTSSNLITTLSNIQKTQDDNISNMNSKLNDKLNLSGGTMSGNLVANAQGSSEVQVHNMVTYPAGTKVEDIEVPPAGTLVVVLE